MLVQTQCCGLVIVCIILYLTYREHSLMLPSKKLYVDLLYATLICLGLDIYSIIGIVVPFPRFWKHLICKIYLCSLALVCYLGFLYADEELRLYLTEKRSTGRKTAILVLGVTGTVLPLFLPVHVYYDGRVLYSYGPACICTYLFCFFFILATLYLCIFRMKHVNRHRRRVIAIWQLTLIIAAIIQVRFPKYLIVGFATSVGLFLLFSQLENPAGDIDRESGCYNLELLKKILLNSYRNGTSFAAVAFVLEPAEGRWNEKERRNAVTQAAEALRSLKKATSFHILSNEFAVIFPDQDTLRENFDSLQKELRNRLENQNGEGGSRSGIRYYLFPDSAAASSMEELVDCHNYYLEHFQDSEITCVDAAAFAEERSYREVKESIKKALDDDRIEVFYQPIYDLTHGDFRCAEALARLRQTDGSLMPPGTFIPVAEDCGLIRAIGLRVLEKVCAFLSQGNAAELGISCIHVNLSAVQLDDPLLAGQISELLARCLIKPGQINLEITESAKIGKKSTAYDTLDKLSKFGIPLSLDDFGTQRSNLDYFIELPISVVKFDRTFTQSYFTSDKTKYVMQSVIGMFKNMGLSVVIEGIETKDEFDQIRKLPISCIQGFYFSKPLPGKDYVRFLQERNTENGREGSMVTSAGVSAAGMQGVVVSAMMSASRTL